MFPYAICGSPNMNVAATHDPTAMTIALPNVYRAVTIDIQTRNARQSLYMTIGLSVLDQVGVRLSTSPARHS
jgi:hypothetical protein